MTRALWLTFCAAFLAILVCSCGGAPEAGTADQEFTCLFRNPVTGICNPTAWLPDLSRPDVTNPPALASVRCAEGYSPAPDRKIKVWTGVNFSGYCEVLSPGQFSMLGDWSYGGAAGPGLPPTEVRIRSMTLGTNVYGYFYAGYGFTTIYDFYSGPTFNFIPDMLEQRIRSTLILANLP